MARPGGNPDFGVAFPAWQPGQSGNPLGRPKNAPVITPRMREYARWNFWKLLELSENPPPDITVADALAITILLKAIQDRVTGDGARDLVVKRLDGEKPDVEVDVRVGVLVRYVDGPKS